MFELNHQNFAASHGVLMNSNGGFYQHGKSYGMETKVLVATKYLEHNARLGGLRPVLTEVAAECRVGRDFVAKIERELMENKPPERTQPPPAGGRPFRGNARVPHVMGDDGCARCGVI